MKAMILAAGLGTRLRPLTNYQPKALVKVKDTPLLEIVIRRLKYYGFTDIVINVHHFAEQIFNFLEKNQNFGVRIHISDERDQILETGGGLKNAASFLNDGTPFLLCNTDILTDLDLRAFYQSHLDSDALVTLGVRDRSSSRYLIFDEQNLMYGWVNINTGKMILSRPHQGQLKLMAFSGLHVIDPEIFKYMPDQSAFSIIDVYLEMAKKQTIIGFPHNDSQWLDVGIPENLEKAKEIFDSLLIE